MSIESIKNHYEQAGKYYEAAAKCPEDSREREAYQDMGDEEYEKASQEMDKMKDETREKAQEYEEKYEEAYKKGDMKAAKEYSDKAEKAYDDLRKVEKEKEQVAREARQKQDGLRRR